MAAMPGGSHGLTARGKQMCSGLLPEAVDTLIQRLFDVVYEILFAHGEIPFAFNFAANALVARKQCVLTLPSLQPITWAVSATSSSSQ